MKKTETTENCMEPIEGPKRMAAHMERLVRLILAVEEQGFVFRGEQDKIFESILNDVMNENSRGASLVLGIQRALEEMRETRIHLAKTSSFQN